MTIHNRHQPPHAVRKRFLGIASSTLDPWQELLMLSGYPHDHVWQLAAGGTEVQHTALQVALERLLTQISASQGPWQELLLAVYGADLSPQRVGAIRESWQRQEWGFQIVWVHEQALPGAWGAMPETGNLLLLNADRLADQSLALQLGVALEEVGHWLDQQLRHDTTIADTPGDEGLAWAQAVASIASDPVQPRQPGGPELAQLRLMDGSQVEAELAASIPVPVPDQVLWSRQFGQHLQGDWNLGDTLGIPNEASYKAFLGLAKPGDDQKYSDIFGTIFDGINKSINIDTGDIGFEALSLFARGSLGIASAQDRRQNATLKAGVELDTGYNLGGVKWDLPLTADLLVKVENEQLEFEINNNFSDAYIDYTLPYLYLYLKGIFETDAALYLDASLGATYLDPFKSLLSLSFKKSTSSFDIHSKLNLSTHFNHSFIDIDTRQSRQVIDWIADRKVFETGAISGQPQSINLGDLFSTSLSLPNFSNLDFSKLNLETDLSQLVDIPTPDLDTQDSLAYSFNNKSKLLDFTFDIDSLISRFLPFPITYKDQKSFRLFGKDIGFEVLASLIDLDLTLSLSIGIQVDFGFLDLIPKLQIENGSNNWVDFDYTSLGVDIRDEAGKVELVRRVNDLDANKDGELDFKISFDPQVFINTRLFAEPEINIITGVGEYTLNIDPIIELGGDNQYIFDTPDLHLFNGKQFDFLKKSYKTRLSDLVDLSAIASIPFAVPINPIANFLNVNLFNGTDGPDFFEGTVRNDVVDLGAGPDVAQMSPGIDAITGGTDSDSTTLYDYLDLFGATIASYSPIASDIFILDSDGIRQSPSSFVQLQPGEIDNFGFTTNQYYALAIQDTSGPVGATILRSVESILLSDELQSSEQGIVLDFRSLPYGKPDQISTIYIGGYRPNEYNAQLPSGVLTGTRGNDTLLVPAGYNRTAPYILGDGNDEVIIGRQSPQLNVEALEGNHSGSYWWHNPYYNYAAISSDDNLSEIIVSQQLIEEIPGHTNYVDHIDLGSGSNSVIFESVNNNYLAFVTSVNPGEINQFTGAMSGLLLIQNLGGSVDLSDLELSGRLYGILGSGGNMIDLSSSQQDGGEITLLLESKALANKLGIEEISDIEIDISNSFINYSSQGQSISDVINLNTERFYYVNFARSDLNDQAARAQLGTSDRYELISPVRQTYIVRENTNPNRVLQFRGRMIDQVNSSCKLIIKENTNQPIYIGLSGSDLFDEVILEDANSPDLALSIYGRVGTLRIMSKGQGVQAIVPEQYDSSSVNYSFSVNTTDQSDTIILDYSLRDLEFRWLDQNSEKSENIGSIEDGELAPTLDQLTIQNPAVPLDLNSFFDQNISPYQTYYLEAGDDRLVTDPSLYEFIYPGSGNHVIISPQVQSTLTYAQPLTGDRVHLASESAHMQSDIVIYTEGSSQDYVISRFRNSIMVEKPDGTVDYLFGIGMIKFETSDVSTLVVPSSQSRDSEPLVDLFGNDVRNRLFYSTTLDENGNSHTQILSNGYARDRLNLTGDQIYQPGRVASYRVEAIPVGLRDFRLTQEFLVRGFLDKDIDHKNLYTIQDLSIENLTVSQGGATIPASRHDDGSWEINLDDFIDDNSSSLKVSYEIKEPEGYLHYVELDLLPDQLQDLNQVKSFSSPSALTLPFVARASDDNITGGLDSDSIAGEGGNDNILGGTGDDSIDGGLGNDNINGGDGDDYLTGGDGDNFLDGEAGNDTLIVSNGSHYLRGGLGDDSYRFDAQVVAGSIIDDAEGWDSLELPQSQAKFRSIPGSDHSNSFFRLEDNTTLLFDANNNKQADPDSDLFIVNFFASEPMSSTPSPGSGLIELINQRSGLDILNTALPLIPDVKLKILTASVLEDGTANLIYTFTRTGATTNSLTVNYRVSGTATLGNDYSGLPATSATRSITFAAGAATARLIVNPTPDSNPEPNETVALRLAAGTGYTVGTTDTVTGLIRNDDIRRTTTFSTTQAIRIPRKGAATPYPSNLSVDGLTGAIVDIKVNLFGLQHSHPDDLDILLVSPAGKAVMLLSDSGGGRDLRDVNLSFSQASLRTLSNKRRLRSGTYRPTNHPGQGRRGSRDGLPAPAPAEPYGQALSSFHGSNPNGSWRLHVLDDARHDSGRIMGGWSLAITTET